MRASRPLQPNSFETGLEPQIAIVYRVPAVGLDSLDEPLIGLDEHDFSSRTAVRRGSIGMDAIELPVRRPPDGAANCDVT
jgi:hypothetical protein